LHLRGCWAGAGGLCRAAAGLALRWCGRRGLTTAAEERKDAGDSFNILMLNPAPWTTRPAIQRPTQRAHEKES